MLNLNDGQVCIDTNDKRATCAIHSPVHQFFWPSGKCSSRALHQCEDMILTHVDTTNITWMRPDVVVETHYMATQKT